jgi:peptide/nickel transport system ATP-binding protein
MRFQVDKKQRVMIAMAIACKPQLLIADEPTTALDVTVQKEIIQLLKDIQQETGMSIIFISHDLSLVSAIAHRL